jgi:hypothetical protein
LIEEKHSFFFQSGYLNNVIVILEDRERRKEGGRKERERERKRERERG